jgi:pescadillo protein
MHDPLIKKFREHRTWKKKVKKAKAKDEDDRVKGLMESKPSYSLAHLVKERYPTFLDAVRDLDDALCMIFLFSIMPSTKKIHQWRIERCQRLCVEFMYYIVRTNSLRKVFLSIKGIYYQADIFGETVTWIVPYKFTQKVSRNIDYKVMMSFLEFYEILLGFVNFKLFNSLGLKYPVVFDAEKLGLGEYLSAVTNINTNIQTESVEDIKQNIENETKNTKNIKLKKIPNEKLKSLANALKNVDDTDDVEMDNSETKNNNDTDMQEKDELDDFGDEETKKLLLEQKIYTGLFKNCVFWLSREVPKDSLEFVIKSFGGKVAWDGDGSFITDENDESITHHIIDRGNSTSSNKLSREYVQPQYVYDCVNCKVLLPVEKYKPGNVLPPHLSPFVDYDKEGYIPEYKKELDSYFKKVNDMEVDDINPIVPMEDDFSDEENDEERYQRELKEEKEGITNDDNPKKRKRKDSKKDIIKAEEDEQAKTAVSLLPRKRRRLLQRIEYGQKKKKDDIDKRMLKKEKLESGEAIINDKGVIQYNNNN